MSINTFKESLTAAEPPGNLPVYLKALWYDAGGYWEKAHELVQDLVDKDAAWIHAYLHRREGDVSNADYWYRRAGKTRPAVSLQEEWEAMATALGA